MHVGAEGWVDAGLEKVPHERPCLARCHHDHVISELDSKLHDIGRTIDARVGELPVWEWRRPFALATSFELRSPNPNENCPFMSSATKRVRNRLDLKIFVHELRNRAPHETFYRVAFENILSVEDTYTPTLAVQRECMLCLVRGGLLWVVCLWVVCLWACSICKSLTLSDTAMTARGQAVQRECMLC